MSLQDSVMREAKTDQADAAQINSSIISGLDFLTGQHIKLARCAPLPFELVRELGIGGSAVVNLVKDRTTGKEIAQKAFPKQYRNFEKYKEWWMEEIRIINRLSSSPHIISVLGSYERDFQFFMLLPVADGGDLRAYLHDISIAEAPISPRQISVLYHAFGCLSTGLNFMHEHVIRHKDIKPQNILIHKDNVIYTDFGISIDASKGSTTSTGPARGFTRDFCAPEVANSEPRNRKSDIFSLGCVFFEILSILEPEIENFEEISRYSEKAEHIRNAIALFNASILTHQDLFHICYTMLEPRREDRIGAEKLVQKIRQIQESRSDGIDLFCDACATDSNSNSNPAITKNDDHDNGSLSDENSETSDGETILERPQNVSGDGTGAQGVLYGEFISLGDMPPSVLQRHIQQVAEKPLYRPHLLSKYIAIFCCPEQPDFIKIIDFENAFKRLYAFKNCNRAIWEYNGHGFNERREIKFAARVARLVRTELRPFQYMEPFCRGCKTTHTEWYCVSPEHATKVINKFSNWMRCKPYECCIIINKHDQAEVSWLLSENGKRQLEVVSEPLPVVDREEEQMDMDKT